MADAFTLDPEIAALCDDAATWLFLTRQSAAMMEITVPQGIDYMVRAANAQNVLPFRLFTGYMPKAQRNAVAHGLYSMGVRKPPARATAADRARSEAAKWGLAR